MRKRWTILAAALALALALGACGGVNRADGQSGLGVPEALELFSVPDAGFSFLYPAGLAAAWSETDGAYVYGGETGSLPYVLICRTSGRGMTPARYFKSCDSLMLKSFSSVQSTPIQQVDMDGRTLYLTRYECSDGGTDYVVDRYVEIYDSFYIEYSAISETACSLDTPLYYAMSTLRVNEDAYTGAFTADVTQYEHPDTGVRIELPDMLEVYELTIGYFVRGRDAVMLCVLCTEDDTGKAIYNRKDFIDRAAAAPEFVAQQLGADSVSFTEGQELKLGGRSFYGYPMEMISGGEDYSGTLCLANDDDTGCWLLCYAVREGSPAQADIAALCQGCAESITFDGGDGT